MSHLRHGEVFDSKGVVVWKVKCHIPRGRGVLGGMELVWQTEWRNRKHLNCYLFLGIYTIDIERVIKSWTSGPIPATLAATKCDILNVSD